MITTQNDSTELTNEKKQNVMIYLAAELAPKRWPLLEARVGSLQFFIGDTDGSLDSICTPVMIPSEALLNCGLAPEADGSPDASRLKATNSTVLEEYLISDIEPH